MTTLTHDAAPNPLLTAADQTEHQADVEVSGAI
jgi:hypothetical protein